MKRFVAALSAVLLLTTLLSVAVAAADETPAAAPETAAPAFWLRLGPVPAPLPAFGDEVSGGFALADLLERPVLDPTSLRPREGAKAALPGAGDRFWRAAATDGGRISLATPAGKTPGEAWLATWVATDRWTEATLNLRGEHPVRAWIDGEALALEKKDDDTRAGAAKLTIGKHLLLVRAVFDAEAESDWAVDASLEYASGPELALTIDPSRPVTIRDVLDAPKAAGTVISPDGRLVVCEIGAIDAAGEHETWFEIRDARTGKLERTWRGDVGARNPKWAPRGHRLSYVTGEEKADIWLMDLADGSVEPIVRGVEDLQDYRWAPDGSWLIYSIVEKTEPDPRKVLRLRDPDDRMPWFRHRVRLVQAAVPGGAARRLTAGEVGVDGWRISPDGESVLFFREHVDYQARPYARRTLWRLDLESLKAGRIIEDRWINAAEWSPDGGRLAILGSPSSFGGAGNVLPEDVLPNEYGGQLFIYDLADGSVEPASRDFDPQISSIRWHRDGRIYALALDRQRQKVFAWDGSWKELDAGVEHVDAVDYARDERTAVVRGSGAAEPQKVMILDLKKGKSKLLLEPAADRYADIRLGKVEPFAVTLPDGREMDGRVHYPVGYDPDETYPTIVYYYGGTSPITRDFGGRYPKNVWTAQGYFVYVPEPSGATGYGQEFAAKHVNDWGRLTADEVIEGTKAFLAAHPAADPDRLGCMGASYGGFLTEYLVTRTDMFACAISHAGISSISSYWGEGNWGYVYGARALAEAFPWSDRELYIEQSPLFHADKIHTPLLLLHGSADTNVPRGESDQLFVALKLLGREVEYVRVLGQDHWILDHDQRIVWNDSIMAWFAKHLKGREAWWNALYPER